jgi:hypothetical protein
MRRCSGGERTSRTTGAGGFYARTAAVTPYRGGGKLGQGASELAVDAASDRGTLGQATRRLNARGVRQRATWRRRVAWAPDGEGALMSGPGHEEAPLTGGPRTSVFIPN